MNIFRKIRALFTRTGKPLIKMRFTVVIAGILLFSAWVMAKALDTALFSARAWNNKAQELLNRTEVIKPERGNILAADGSVLATNLTYYTLRLDYRTDNFSTDTLKKYVGPLSECLAADYPLRNKKGWEEYLLEELDKEPARRSRAKLLLTNLSLAEVEKVQRYPYFIKGRVRSGLTKESFRRRTNPYGMMALRSIGRVGQTDVCSEVHGISGLEKALDSLLYGTPGETRKQVLTHGIVNWASREAVPGFDIQTTIDINMQDIVENELNSILEHVDADWGLAVLMEVETGNIRAISNLERHKVTGKYVEAMNHAVQRYEPGSVIKTLSMLIALENGLVPDLDETIPTGSMVYMGRAITDSHRTEAIKVREVLEQSSNIAMTRIITRGFEKHPKEFRKRIEEIGFLEPLNIGISGETVPLIDTLSENRNGRLTLSRQCFGYSTEIPPMHTLALYNAIANDGRFVRPRLVQRQINAKLGIDSLLPVTCVRERICSQDNARILRDMLKQVVWGDHGTAKVLRNDLVEIAGKTGTAYVVDATGYNFSKKRLAFCGFFPADRPKYSCIALTCAPKKNWFGAATTSGQVVRNIAVKLYSRGLLDYRPDYRPAPGDPAPRPARLAAGAPAHTVAAISAGLGVKPRVLRKAADAPGVPNVRGMDLRRAVASLEGAGFNVTHQGTGTVTAMDPPAASSAKPGTTVTLTLR